jgi:multiple sugar transport system permease protein
LLWTSLHLVNTNWPLVLPHWFGSDVFFIFLLRQFFLTIPRELDEAAILDGANPLQVLWHIILPLSRPALATVAILSGLAAWNLLRPTLLRRRREPHRIERVILP